MAESPTKYKCAADCPFTSDRTKAHLLHHAIHKIPTIIKYNERNLMPSRADFLDPALMMDAATKIKLMQPLAFLPNDICEPKIYEFGAAVYQPYMFGVLPCGTKICVILRNVPIYFDIKLPDCPPKESDTMLHDSAMNREWMAALCAAMNEEGITVSRTDVVQLYPAEGFRLVRHPYMRIFFKTMEDYRRGHQLATKTYVGVPMSADDRVSFGGRPTYINKVLREYKISAADWNIISNYELVEGKTKCQYTFYVDVMKIRPITDAERKCGIAGNMRCFDYDNTIVAQWDIETQGELPTVLPESARNVMKRKGKDGRTYHKPMHFETHVYRIHMINSSYYFHWSNKSLIDVCCVDYEIGLLNGDKGGERNTLITIICGDESEVLLMHQYMLVQMRPDIMSAFNGGHFDWPMCAEKLHIMGKLGEFKRDVSCLIETYRDAYDNEKVWQYSFMHNVEVKMSAERTHIMARIAMFSGIVDSDVMLNFLRLYPRAEISKSASLNFFLAANDLESKEDMPYQRMFKIFDRAKLLQKTPKVCHCGDIDSDCMGCKSVVPSIDCIGRDDLPEDDPNKYSDVLIDEIKGKCCYCGKRRRNLADMELVAIYCRIDCQRPQELNNKRAIFGEKRELATLSYMPLFNTLFYADGEKVRNLLAAYCFDDGTAFSTQTLQKGDHEKDHFVGGYVVPPIMGRYLVPVTGLDFESLYPSLMATYNLSPDMLVKDEEFANYLINRGYSLIKLVDESGTHLTYNRGEKKNAPTNEVFKSHAWTVRHNNIMTTNDKQIITGYKNVRENPGAPTPIYGRAPLPHEQMGFMARAVSRLKDLRRPVKAALNKLKNEKEELLLRLRDANDDFERDEIRDLIADNNFMNTKINSKSQSIKVLNNTVYGQVSQFRNSFYCVDIGAAITAFGRRNTRRIKEEVEKLGFSIAYGDTDSLYILCPDRLYDEARRQLASNQISREQYYTMLVQIAMKTMGDLANQVYEILVRDNGTLFLKMAYEEVALPFALFGKKKYAMVSHLQKINFFPDEPDIKGLEMKKQGQYLFSKELQKRFVDEIMNINVNAEMIDVALGCVRDFFKIAPDPVKFARMHNYRPHKQNKTVLTFVERMRQERMPLPDPGDKFRTVVVKRPISYTIRGTIEKCGVGDKMEYLHRVMANPQQFDLDLDYYLEAGVFGAFARFIAYHTQFALADDVQATMKHKDIDKMMINAATSYLKQFCKSWTNSDNSEAKARGRQLRSEFNLAAKALTSANRVQCDAQLRRIAEGKAICGVAINKGDIAKPMAYIGKLRDTMRAEFRSNVPRLFMERALRHHKVFALKSRYEQISGQRRVIYERLELAVVRDLCELLPVSWASAAAHKLRIEEMVRNGEINGNCDISENDIVVANQIETLLIKLRSYINCRQIMINIRRLIEEEIARETDTAYVPRINARELARNESKSTPILGDYTFL